MIEILSLLVDAFFIYLAIGVLFGIWFVVKGAAKLDDGVKDTPWHFRAILFPGSVLIWSILILKLVNKKG